MSWRKKTRRGKEEDGEVEVVKGNDRLELQLIKQPGEAQAEGSFMVVVGEGMTVWMTRYRGQAE